MNKHRLQPIALVIVLLLGFALRLYRLGAANIWWDEAFSLWMANKPLPDMLVATAFDTHPPLYMALLHGWLQVAGDSEFAARLLSAIIGTLTVALLYPLGRRLVGARGATFGTLLLALSPFHVWWSQEIRMYALSALWATLAMVMLVRQMGPGRSPGGWIAYTLAVVAAISTMYLSVLVILAAGLTVLLLWATRCVRWTRVLEWTAAQAAALLLYLPWLLYALPRIRSGGMAADFSPTLALSLYVLTLSTAISTHVDQYALLSAAYGALLCATPLALALRRRWWALSTLLPALLLPPLVIVVLTTIDWRFYAPKLEARYFLLLAPLAALVPAAAVTLLGRWRRWAGRLLAAALVALALWALPLYYADRHLGDQWKSAVRIISAYAAPNDVVALVSADRFPLFVYEYERMPEGRPTVQWVPDGVPTLTAETIEAQMTRATAGAARVWLVEIESTLQDPDGLARAWLEARWRPAYSVAFDYNRLTLYTADGALPFVPTERFAPQVTLAGDGLLGVDLPLREFRPGDTVHLGLYVRAAPVTVRLQHESGLIVDERFLPAVEGGIVRHDVPFAVTQATPRGDYTLSGNGITLATLRVTHSDPLWREADVPVARPAVLGDSIEFLGYELLPAHPRPGQALTLHLYWRVDRPPQRAYTVFTQLVGPLNPASNSPLWGQHDSPPVDGTLPIDRWPADLIVRDTHGLLFDPAAPPGSYTLIVGMYNPQDGTRLAVPGTADNALPLAEWTVP